MQHGTAREYITDLLENALAITKQNEVHAAVFRALEVLDDTFADGTDIDKPGVFGPDYCDIPRVTQAEKNQALEEWRSWRDANIPGGE